MTTLFQRIHRSRVLGSFVLFTSITNMTFAAERKVIQSVGSFPSIQAENLNEKQFNLPTDFPSDRTLLLLGFKREEADTLETWIEGHDLKEKEMAWFEMPVIPSFYLIDGFFIDGAMRRGTRRINTNHVYCGPATRQRCVPLARGNLDQPLEFVGRQWLLEKLEGYGVLCDGVDA